MKKMKENKILHVRLSGFDARKMSCGKKWRLYRHSDGSCFLTRCSLSGFQKKYPHFNILSEKSISETGVQIFYPLESLCYDRPSEDAQAEVMAYALAHSVRGKIPRVIYFGRTREEISGSFVLDCVGKSRHYRWKLDNRSSLRKVILPKEKFSRLAKKIKSSDTRFVLSLGGGGLRLFALPTVFKILEGVEVHNVIEEIWGCSGGAIAGLFYSMGASPDAIEQEGYNIYNRKYRFQLSPSTIEVMGNLLKNKFIPDRVIGFKDFIEIQKKLNDILRRISKNQKATIPFYSIAYNLSLKKREILTPNSTKFDLQEEWIRQTSPIDAVLASSALPILFSPYNIKGSSESYAYIDGCMVEDLPLLSIYKKWVLDQKMGLTQKKKLLILAVDLFPHLGHWKYLAGFLSKHLPAFGIFEFLGKILEQVRMCRIEEHLEFVKKDQCVSVIELHLPQIQRSLLNPRTIPIIIEKAQSTFIKQLIEVEKHL